MICPRMPKAESSTGLTIRAVKYFKSFFSDSDEANDGSVERESVFTNVNVMRKTCLELYLEKEFPMIAKGSVSTDIISLIDKITFVISCLFSPYLHDGSRKGRSMYKQWDCFQFVQVFVCLYSYLVIEVILYNLL